LTITTPIIVPPRKDTSSIIQLFFYHPDCTVGFRVSRNQSHPKVRVAGFNRRSGIAPSPEELSPQKYFILSLDECFLCNFFYLLWI